MGYYLQRALKEVRGVSMSGNEHDGSNIEPVAKRLRALKGSLGMVIEQSPLAIHVLTPDGQVKAAERLRIGNELRRGVEREEFVLHYQPIVALQTSKVVMVEALACWEHRKGGLLFLRTSSRSQSRPASSSPSGGRCSGRLAVRRRSGKLVFPTTQVGYP